MANAADVCHHPPSTPLLPNTPYAARVIELAAAVRLVSYLNHTTADPTGHPQAARGIIGADVAHHIVDREGILSQHTLAAQQLLDLLPGLVGRPGQYWVLAIPAPGRLSPLTGPPAFVRAALTAGVAAVRTGEVGLVPHSVGAAIQWEALPANPPSQLPTAYEAERELSETVLRTARELAELEVAAGTEPTGGAIELAPTAAPRQRAAALRAGRLWFAATGALETDGSSLSAYVADRRRFALREIQTAAAQALCVAVSQPPQHRV